MTDVPAWLRNFRATTISSTPPPLPSIERTNYLEWTNDNFQAEDRPLNVRRVSSFFSLSRTKTPSLISMNSNINPPAHLDAQADEVWQNADETQVVETLKGLLMTMSVFEPIPAQYKSCILQVLEAYVNMRDVAKTKTMELEEAHAFHVKQVEGFLQERRQWEEKEDEYKNDIKKLEITIASGAPGLNLLRTARSTSCVYKTNRRSKKDNPKYGVGNNGSICAVDGPPEMMTVDYATKRDCQTSQRFTTRPRYLQSREPAPALMQEAKQISTNIKRVHKPPKTLSSISTSTDDSLHDIEESSTFEGLDEFNTKPLPELPDTGLENTSTRKRGFSFEAGDDYEILPVSLTTRRAIVQKPSTGSPQSSSEEDFGAGNKIESTEGRRKSSPAPALRHTRREISKFERSFSSQSSSTITAVRDNSGRSSKRPLSGGRTAEAAAKAAVRALAGN